MLRSVFTSFSFINPSVFSFQGKASRLDSPESYSSSLFIRVAILTSLSSSAFVRRMTLYSISAIFSSTVEVLVIITGMTSRYDEENDETR